MTKEILLHGKHVGKVAKVDDCDYDWLMERKWFYHVAGYAQAFEKIGSKWVTVFMHRLIMNTPKGLHTDHIDGDGLNNVRCNLRICTPAQNQFNSRKQKGAHKYKGIGKRGDRFIAFIRVEGKNKYLGSFGNEVEAAEAYDEAARKYYGAFARTNFE